MSHIVFSAPKLSDASFLPPPMANMLKWRGLRGLGKPDFGRRLVPLSISAVTGVEFCLRVSVPVIQVDTALAGVAPLCVIGSLVKHGERESRVGAEGEV